MDGNTENQKKKGHVYAVKKTLKIKQNIKK